MARVGGKGQYFDVKLTVKWVGLTESRSAYFTDIAPPRRPLGFRPGVHKSESAKEMLLSQTIFGPLPPSPPSSSPEVCVHIRVLFIFVLEEKNVSKMADFMWKNDRNLIICPFIILSLFRKLTVSHRYHHHHSRSNRKISSKSLTAFTA